MPIVIEIKQFTEKIICLESTIGYLLFIDISIREYIVSNKMRQYWIYTGRHINYKLLMGTVKKISL